MPWIHPRPGRDVARDIARPLREQGGAVIEVNAGPGLRMHLRPSHGSARPVGRAIVEDLQSRLNGFLVVTLTAAPDVHTFYEKLGWRNLITGMIRPRSKEQARLNCPDETE